MKKIPLAYPFDMENGLPIKTWYENKYDVDLGKIAKILEFLAKMKDLRKYIKKFVKENEIIYEDSMNYIKNIENKNKNINNNLNNNNKNSFISKTNVINNLNNTSNNYKNSSNTKSMNTVNKMNN